MSSLHVMTYNPNKSEHILSYDIRRVAFTNSHGQTETVTMYLHHRQTIGGQNKYTLNLDITTSKVFCREALTLCTNLFKSITVLMMSMDPPTQDQ